MNDIAVVPKSNRFLKKVAYNIKYGIKFKKLNIDKSFSEALFFRSNGQTEKEVLGIISKSKNQDDFENKVQTYLKSESVNIYSSTLLVGNITGKYVFNDFCYDYINNLNIDAFSRKNEELLEDLKLHFGEYVMSNNKNKNAFAEKTKVGELNVKDLSQDINYEKLDEEFDNALSGQNDKIKSNKVIQYVMKTIGTYSKEDIKENFDFILYDINRHDNSSVDDRREKYMLHKGLSDSQLQKINEIGILKKRLQDMNKIESQELLSRLDNIDGALDQNITELEDIYSDYEFLYRQDLVDNLYVPQEDVTIIEDYKDMKPQLIHVFMRNPEVLRDNEIKKIKEKIISERTDKSTDEDLTEEEQERFDKLTKQLDANLDSYKVNYTTDGKGSIYTDSSGLDNYYSDTSNQISASLYEGSEFVNSKRTGIIGIGFNNETLTPEAIAVSSNSYKTTNKGLNNIEYDEDNEFKEMSAPFSELAKSKGKSEIVMHRRGMDFDTKASYIFATVDSSDREQTKNIVRDLKRVKEKEGLKVVIYDLNKIKESLELSKQKETKDLER